MCRSEIVAIYADGGLVLRSPSPIAGTYAWCHVDAESTRVRTGEGLLFPEHVKARVVSNNQAEFYALLLALEALPNDWSGIVASDSSNALARVREPYVPTFGVATFHNLPTEWWWRMIRVKQRLGRLTMQQLRGHPSQADLRAGFRDGLPVSEHNRWCDLRCRSLAQNYYPATRLTR